MSKSYIDVSKLSVSYGSIIVLKDLHFRCDDGEFVSIVGKSGAGKSSFLNALSGFIPYHGNIKIPKNIGYVFQKNALFPWLTVRQNIGFGLTNLSKKEKKKHIDEMLKRIEMKEYSKQYPQQLSGGQIQRVALARALAPDPDVIFMDEPYGALDHHIRDKMQEWLLSIWQLSKMTVLFVTHYIEEAVFLADRIVVINSKSIVHDMHIPFKRPRDNKIRFSKKFLDIKHQILDVM